MARVKRGQSDMAHTDRTRRHRFLWKNVRNVSLVIVLGAMLCVGGTLAYLNAKANTMLDTIQADEVPKVSIMNSYVNSSGEKVETSNVAIRKKENPSIAEGLFESVSDLKLTTHTVNASTGAIMKSAAENSYNNLIVQVKNEGAPAFVRVWIGAPLLVDDAGPSSTRKEDQTGLQWDSFELEYRNQAPFPKPGAVPSDAAINNNAATNDNMVPFGFNGRYNYQGAVQPTKDGQARDEDARYGMVVYHFAENWQENWIYVGNSGYLDELDTNEDDWRTDWETIVSSSNPIPATETEFPAGLSGGYFVYKHVLGVDGVTAPLLVGVSYDEDRVDNTDGLEGVLTYNVQVELACDAVTALEDTFELARDNLFGWGNGLPFRERTSVWSWIYDEDEDTFGADEQSPVIQPFSENKIVYSTSADAARPSSNSESLAKRGIEKYGFDTDAKKWYQDDMDKWYVVQDALVRDESKDEVTNGRTLEQVINAEISTRPKG